MEDEARDSNPTIQNPSLELDKEVLVVKKTKKQNKYPKLEVPSEATQSARRSVSLEKLINPPKRPKTSKIQPSSLLSRVKDFIPQIQTANLKLDGMNKEDFVIDQVPDDAESYIEMNVVINSESDWDEEQCELASSDTDSDSEAEITTESTLKKLIVELSPNDPENTITSPNPSEIQ